MTVTLLQPVQTLTTYEITVLLRDDPRLHDYRVEAAHLDALANTLERLIRAITNTRDHVSIRIDINGSIWVRYNLARATQLGCWKTAS